MNKKGMEMSNVGVLVIAAVAIIVVMTLIPTIASNMSSMTNTNTFTNQSKTFPDSKGTVKYITLSGQAASSVVVVNASGAVTIPASNYSITNYVVNNGALETRLTAVDPTYANYSVKVTYVSEPFGYDTNGGGRAIAGLVIVLAALAVAIVVISYVVNNNDVFDF